MSRRILAQVTAPAAGIGLLLFVACVTSAWYINNLQTQLVAVLKQNVASAKASQELEGTARQLRFQCFLYLLRPDPATLREIEIKEAQFEHALDTTAATCQGSDEEKRLIQEIRDNYDKYRNQFDARREHLGSELKCHDYSALAQASPVDAIVQPCLGLLDIHDQRALVMADESERFSSYLRIVMLLLGLVGPLGGILSGYGIARGLSRSIYRLSVRVKDISEHLEHDVGSVSVTADTDIHNLDGQLERVVRRVEQVTERLQRQQRELLRTEQLSAVGKLAASVAHEIRNPLTSVKILVGLAVRKQNPKPLTHDDLRVIHDEVGRVERTVQQLLDFARLPEPQRSECDLREVVGRAADLVRGRAQQQAVELRLPELAQPLPAAVDADQLHSALVNLLLNSLDAMPQGGVLDLELKHGHDGDILLRIADTGPGLDETVLSRIFEPFVSTKPTGTGLGLSICRRIVEEHEGSIRVQNRPDGGACFTIRLPARPAESTHPERTRAETTHADAVDR